MGGTPAAGGLADDVRYQMAVSSRTDDSRASSDQRRDDREHGAVIVETAFTITLLIMLLLGIVTSGVAYHQNNTLQTAAREGSRFGATLPVSGSIAGWLDSVRDVTKSAAVGNLDPGVPGQYICVAMVGSTTQRLVETGGTDSTSGSACFSDGRPAGEDRVQVVVEREATINALVFSTDVTLSSSSAARYER